MDFFQVGDAFLFWHSAWHDPDGWTFSSADLRNLCLLSMAFVVDLLGFVVDQSSSKNEVIGDVKEELALN